MITYDNPDPVALPLERYGASRSEYLGAVADQAWMMNPAPSILRYAERRGEAGDWRFDRTTPIGVLGPGFQGDPTLTEQVFGETIRQGTERLSPELSAEDANKRYGHLGLKFTTPVRERVADLMAESKIREQAYQRIFERARVDGGYGALSAILGAATDFAVNAADPLNIASAFIPIVGEARWAQIALRAGLPAARVARGTIEGAVGAAIVEPFVLVNALDEQLDYKLEDSFLNILFGGVLGGGLHWMGGAIRDRFRGRIPESDLRDMAAGREIMADPTGFLDSDVVRAAIDRSARDAAGDAFSPYRVPYEVRERARVIQDTGDYRFAYAQTEPVFGSPPMQPWAVTMDALSPETRERIMRAATAQLADDRRIDVEAIARADMAYKPPDPATLQLLSTVSPDALRWAQRQGDPAAVAGIVRVLETEQRLVDELSKSRARAAAAMEGVFRAGDTPQATKARAAAARRTQATNRTKAAKAQAALSAAIERRWNEMMAERLPAGEPVAFAGFGPPTLTAPPDYRPNAASLELAGIITGETKPLGTFKQWVVQQGGLRDEGGELAARDIRPGAKGVPPGMVNNQKAAGDKRYTSKAGLSVEEMTAKAVEDGWLPAGKGDAWEAAGARDIPTDRFLDTLADAVNAKTPFYHPDSPHAQRAAEAREFLDFAESAGLPLDGLSTRDVAYLIERGGEVAEAHQEWRYINGLLDELDDGVNAPAALEAAAALDRRIADSRMAAYDEAARRWQAEARPEGFDPDLEAAHSGRSLTKAEFEALHAEIDAATASHRDAIADRIGNAQRDEEGARPVAAGDGRDRQGAAPDNGAPAAAAEVPGPGRQGQDGTVDVAALAREIEQRAAAEGYKYKAFHGTDRDFAEFDTGKAGSATPDFYLGRALYFADEPFQAGLYAVGAGANIRPVFLKLENPLVIERTTDVKKTLQRFGKVVADHGVFKPKDPEAFAAAVQKAGYDGIIMGRPGMRQYAVFDSSQIKSQFDFGPKRESAVERTDQGLQSVIPGAEALTPEQMQARIVANGVAAKLQAAVRQEGGDGLFDVQGRGQLGLGGLSMSDAERIAAKYGADPAGLDQRLTELATQRAQLAGTAGGAKKLAEVQRQIAAHEEARGLIEKRAAEIGGDVEAMARRQAGAESDALAPAPGERSFLQAVGRAEGDAAELQRQTDSLLKEIGDALPPEEADALRGIDRQASDFLRAGEAYLSCKAGDGE